MSRQKNKITCGAHARSTGQSCQAKALSNGRCRNHGGLSTGPRTAEGKKAISEATAKRMASGQQVKALQGLKAWLDAGGREYLSKLQKARFKRKQWLTRLVKW